MAEIDLICVFGGLGGSHTSRVLLLGDPVWLSLSFWCIALGGFSFLLRWVWDRLLSLANGIVFLSFFGCVGSL